MVLNDTHWGRREWFLVIMVSLMHGLNHSFYSLRWESEVLDKSLGWLDERYPRPSAPESAASGPMPTGAPA